MESEFADTARWIIMAIGVLLIGFAGAVIQEARKFRAPSAHIYLIAISYAVLVMFAIVALYDRLGNSFSWRIPISFVSFGFGLFAMVSMFRFYKPENRVKRHSEKSIIRAAEVLDEVESRLTSEGIDSSVEQEVRQKLQNIREREQDKREIEQDARD